MQISVFLLLFGALKEGSSISLQLPENIRVKDLLIELSQRKEIIGDYKIWVDEFLNVCVIRDGVLLALEDNLNEGDIIRVFPQLHGG